MINVCRIKNHGKVINETKKHLYFLSIRFINYFTCITCNCKKCIFAQTSNVATWLLIQWHLLKQYFTSLKVWVTGVKVTEYLMLLVGDFLIRSHGKVSNETYSAFLCTFKSLMTFYFYNLWVTAKSVSLHRHGKWHSYFWLHDILHNNTQLTRLRLA